MSKVAAWIAERVWPWSEFRELRRSWVSERTEAAKLSHRIEQMQAEHEREIDGVVRSGPYLDAVRPDIDDLHRRQLL